MCVCVCCGVVLSGSFYLRNQSDDNVISVNVRVREAEVSFRVGEKTRKGRLEYSGSPPSLHSKLSTEEETDEMRRDREDRSFCPMIDSTTGASSLLAALRTIALVRLLTWGVMLPRRKSLLPCSSRSTFLFLLGLAFFPLLPSHHIFKDRTEQKCLCHRLTSRAPTCASP